MRTPRGATRSDAVLPLATDNNCASSTPLRKRALTCLGVMSLPSFRGGLLSPPLPFIRSSERERLSCLHFLSSKPLTAESAFDCCACRRDSSLCCAAVRVLSEPPPHAAP